jgi:hypothetical protein
LPIFISIYVLLLLFYELIMFRTSIFISSCFVLLLQQQINTALLSLPRTRTPLPDWIGCIESGPCPFFRIQIHDFVNFAQPKHQVFRITFLHSDSVHHFIPLEFSFINFEAINTTFDFLKKRSYM